MKYRSRTEIASKSVRKLEYRYLCTENAANSVRKHNSYEKAVRIETHGEFLTDWELFTELVKILYDKYAGAKLGTISNDQKLDLARTLFFKYHSSNGQIRRLLGLTQYDVGQMVPEM